MASFAKAMVTTGACDLTDLSLKGIPMSQFSRSQFDFDESKTGASLRASPLESWVWVWAYQPTSL